jgi:hypothetical protein
MSCGSCQLVSDGTSVTSLPPEVRCSLKAALGSFGLDSVRFDLHQVHD